MKNKILKLTKVGSVLKNLSLPDSVEITSEIQAVDGEVIVVEALKSQKKYGELELTDGQMSKIKKGDVIAGVLGQRKALEGIVGNIPQNLKVNDIIHILNLGGVVGVVESWNPDFIDSPLPVKVLGAIKQGNSSLNIKSFSLKPQEALYAKVPVLLILGSSMGVGKTTVVKEVIHLLAEKNSFKVAAAKLTGVATQRDMFAMKNAGALSVLSFLDVGLTSTINQDGVVVSASNTILNSLSKEDPDIIIVELGDGVVGWYGVDRLLQNREFIKTVIFVIGCANDLVGAVGLQGVLQKVELKIDFFAGPVTNNSAGTDYLEQFLQIPGQDLRYGHAKLVQTLIKKGVQVHD